MSGYMLYVTTIIKEYRENSSTLHWRRTTLQCNTVRQSCLIKFYIFYKGSGAPLATLSHVADWAPSVLPVWECVFELIKMSENFLLLISPHCAALSLSMHSVGWYRSAFDSPFHLRLLSQVGAVQPARTSINLLARHHLTGLHVRLMNRTNSDI